MLSNRLAKNRVQIGGSVRLEFCSQAESDTQTNCSENITPQFCGGVKKEREDEEKTKHMILSFK